MKLARGKIEEEVSRNFLNDEVGSRIIEEEALKNLLNDEAHSRDNQERNFKKFLKCNVFVTEFPFSFAFALYTLTQNNFRFSILNLIPSIYSSL